MLERFRIRYRVAATTLALVLLTVSSLAVAQTQTDSKAAPPNASGQRASTAADDPAGANTSHGQDVSARIEAETGKPSAQVKIALEYEMPFLTQFGIKGRMAAWLSRQSRRKNRALGDVARGNNGVVMYDYDRHGLIPWMQFFYEWRFNDLDGDGKIDFIMYNGARRQIAFRQDGGELWRYENPEVTNVDIRFDSPFPIVDIDEDGQVEFICARKLDGVLHLCVVDGKTGEVEKSAVLPSSAERKFEHAMIRMVDVSGQGYPSDILIGWTHDSLRLFDRELKPLWNVSESSLQKEHPRKHRIMAHTQAFADLDSDGREEIFAGSALLDDDGKVLSVLTDLASLVKDTHSDSNLIVPLGVGKQPNLLSSTGAYCFDRDGQLLWEGATEISDRIRHGQRVLVGKIRRDLPGQQVLVYDAASRAGLREDRLLVFDSRGKLLWQINDVATPYIQEGGFGFAVGDWDGDGQDEVFLNDATGIDVFDGHGRKVARLPYHLIYAFDMIGDSRTEVIAVDGIKPGMKMFVLTNGQANPHAETNAVIQKGTVPRSVYNMTRY